MEIRTRNINTAFKTLVSTFVDNEGSIKHGDIITRENTRNGTVLRIDEPVMVTYEKPLERVLFNAARDCNPFFHLFEALWMISGRNDLTPLVYYNQQMREYSDDGGTLNGAYGYRWRHASITVPATGEVSWSHELQEVDQLTLLATHLSQNPTSRRAVLQMWNIEDDLLKVGLHLERSGNFYNEGLALPASKDVCCNLSVIFTIRPKEIILESHQTLSGISAYGGPYLDMTVFNRSNDMIWGMLGANYVHFTFLQEYMAARIGVEIGRYHHITNNLHVYESNWKPEQWLAGDCPDYYEEASSMDGGTGGYVPLVRDPVAFEHELPVFVEHHSGKLSADKLEDQWTEPFFSEVAGPLLTAFACHKEKSDHCAFQALDTVLADDWRLVATQWLRRRMK